MAAIITENFRIQSAIAFLDSVVNSTVLYYLGISKHTPWDANDGIGADETNPPFPTSNDQAIANLWRQMLAAKRVEPSRVSLSIPRHDWETGTTYVRYDTRDDSLFRKPFYVVTSEFNVYKCLDNNGGGVVSDEPTHTSGTATTADGYVWHFMYGLSAADANKYITPQFIPIPSSYVPSAQNGLIVTITVDYGGTGYTSAPTVTINGNGSAAPTVDSVTLNGDAVESISISGGSSDFDWADVQITGGGATTDAIAHANVAPKDGHGNNILAELGAFYVTMNVRLEYDENQEVTINNEYRKMCLIRNPLVQGAGGPFTGTVADQRVKYTLSGAISGTFNYDETVTSTINNATAKVVEHDKDNEALYVTDILGDITAGDLVGSDSGETAQTVTLALDNIGPEIEPYSGTIDYVEHRKQIVRASDQVEEIRVTFEW